MREVVFWILIPIWITWLIWLSYCTYKGLLIHRYDHLKSMNYALMAIASNFVIAIINLMAMILLRIIK